MSAPTQAKIVSVQPPSDPTLRAAMYKNKLWWLVECYCPSTGNDDARMYFHLDLDGKEFSYPSDINKSALECVAYGSRHVEPSLFWLPDPIATSTSSWAIRIFLTNGIDFQCELPATHSPLVMSTSNMANHQVVGSRVHFDFGVNDTTYITLVCHENPTGAPSLAKGCFTVTAMYLHAPFFTPAVKAIIDELTEPLLVVNEMHKLRTTLKRDREEDTLTLQGLGETLRAAKRRCDEERKNIFRLQMDRLDIRTHLNNVENSLNEAEKIIQVGEEQDSFKDFRHKAPRSPETNERLRLVAELEYRAKDFVGSIPFDRVLVFEAAFRCTLLSQKYRCLNDSANILDYPNTDAYLEALDERYADVIAKHLCTLYGVDFNIIKADRLKQLHECCAKLRAHFKSL